MWFSFSKALRHRESSTYLVRLYQTVSSASIDANMHFLYQIHSIDTILIEYWMEVQVRTMMSIFMYERNFRISNTMLSRVLTIPCEIFLRKHLRHTRRIALLVSGRGRVGGLGDELRHLWYFLCPVLGLLVSL